MIVPGQLGDLSVLSSDYLTVPEEEIRGIESVLTIVGGKIVYAGGEFGNLAPPPLPVSPEWSPVARYGGYHGAAPAASLTENLAHSECTCHGLRRIWPPKDARLWGSGCDCFAF